MPLIRRQRVERPRKQRNKISHASLPKRMIKLHTKQIAPAIPGQPRENLEKPRKMSSPRNNTVLRLIPRKYVQQTHVMNTRFSRSKYSRSLVSRKTRITLIEENTKNSRVLERGLATCRCVMPDSVLIYLHARVNGHRSRHIPDRVRHCIARIVINLLEH